MAPRWAMNRMDERGRCWTTLGRLMGNEPASARLVLTTPLEQLLELPNAVRIAACAWRRFTRLQRRAVGADVDQHGCRHHRHRDVGAGKHGGELIDRYEKRDLTGSSRSPIKAVMAAPEVSPQRIAITSGSWLCTSWAVIEATADTP